MRMSGGTHWAVYLSSFLLLRNRHFFSRTKSSFVLGISCRTGRIDLLVEPNHTLRQPMKMFPLQQIEMHVMRMLKSGLWCWWLHKHLWNSFDQMNMLKKKSLAHLEQQSVNCPWWQQLSKTLTHELSTNRNATLVFGHPRQSKLQFCLILRQFLLKRKTKISVDQNCVDCFLQLFQSQQNKHAIWIQLTHFIDWRWCAWQKHLNGRFVKQSWTITAATTCSTGWLLVFCNDICSCSKFTPCTN